MQRESHTVAAREAAASKELAERLDTLSRPLAERILGRAIEIQHEAQSRADSEAASIGYEELRDIALEVGIPEDALERALLEELETERDPGATRLERLTTPKHIRGGTVVAGDRSEVERRLREYLEATGGLELIEQRTDGLTWGESRQREQRVLASHTTDQRREDRHLLELDFNTAAGRKKARRLALVAIILGTIFGGAIGGLAIVGGIGVGIAAGVAGAVAWMRRIGRAARRRINGALEAAANDQPPRTHDRTWLDVWESQR